MNKKAEFKISSAFYALVLVSAMVIATGIWVGEWNDTYDSGLSSDLDTFNKLANVSDTASSYEGNISVKSSTQGEEFEGTVLRGVFGFLNNIFKPFQVVLGDGGMVDSLTDRWGIPDYVRITVVTVATFAMVFALVRIFFRLPKRSA